MAGALVAYLLRVHGRLWEHSYRFVDALALGCWAAAGAQLTLSDSLSWQAAVLLGTVTAVGGGVVRDVLLRDVPQIFGGNRLYATSAVLASIVLVLCHGLGLARLGILGGTVVGAGLCLISYQRGWSLPRRERSRNRVNRVNSLSTSALALWRTPVAVISGVLPRSPGQVTLAAAAVPTAARARPAGRPRRR